MRYAFQVIKQSPMYVSTLQKLRKPKCDKGYVLLKDKEGKFSLCPAKESNEHHFCICNGLLSSADYNADKEEPLYTVGTNAHRVDRILSVKDLIGRVNRKSCSCLIESCALNAWRQLFYSINKNAHLRYSVSGMESRMGWSKL